jgi:adenylate cyclase
VKRIDPTNDGSSDTDSTAAVSGEPAITSSRPTREDLEREILGESPHLTSTQIVGDDEEKAQAARRLWRALGFPDAGDTAAFTASDREAMAKLSALVEAGALEFETAVRLTRAVGHTMARLADWQVSTISEIVEKLEQTGEGTGSRLTTALEVIRAVEPTFEDLLMYAWRRHLAAAVSRVEALGAKDSDLHTVTVTVGFADLVSFTELANGIDEDDLADVVEVFESACSDLIAARGGRVIKTLGDSVLFIAETAVGGVDIACDIVERVGGDRDLPDVHVGLATGPVVMRLGDVFGPPVNMASRLTGVARRNRVICDDTTAAVVRELPGYRTRPMTERPIRGFGAVAPIAVRRTDRGVTGNGLADV